MRYMKGGGGSSAPQPTEQRVTTTDLPEYARPYVERLLQRGESESLQPYTPYGGQRIAYFSPDELQSQAMTRGFALAGTPQEYQDATARVEALGAGRDSAYPAGTLGPMQYSPTTFDSGYQAGDLQSGFQASQFDPGYQASVRTSGYQAGANLPQYQKLGFEEGVGRFMSPFQQAVTDIEKREAIRQSDIAGQGISQRAAQSGGLGGYREAILQAERERNLSQQLGDIQARGSQAAFDRAVSQVGAERAADLAASQFGLSAFGQEQQAQQRQEQLAQQAFQQGELARQQAARLGLSAQQQEEASRQAQERFSQSAFQLQQQAQQQQARLGLTAQQAQDAAAQAAERLRQQGFTAEEAAKQAQERFGQSAYDLSQRFGLQAAGQLADLGSLRQQDALGRISALESIGRQQRALQQAGLDMGYQDFLNQRDFTKNQLADFSALIRGIPIQPTQTVSTFQQQPGLFQQGVGLGLSGLGLYRGRGG